jgi:rod shape-determining protein MreD
MNNLLIVNIIRFFFLVFLQIFIVDKVQLSIYINPCVYIAFILLLPVDLPKWLLLVLAFITGLTVDLFSGILGIHAAATVFMAYAKPGVIRLVGEKDDAEPNLEPNIKNFGFLWFITYISLMVLLHHTALFFIEVFRLNEILNTLVRVLASSVVSIVLILIIQLLFIRRVSMKRR